MATFIQSPLGLSCEGVPLAAVADAVGTPVYVYSGGAIREAYASIDAAFAGQPHDLHYALKANSALALLRLVRGLGAGADANSVGEIEVALRAGFIPSAIVFTGVGKSPAELERAISLGVKAINAESPGEVDRIDAIARSLGTRARVAIRVNPDISAESHPHISTGRRSTKFGVPIEAVRPLYREMARRPALDVVGIHAHIGSQIVRIEPLRRMAETLAELVRQLRSDGIALEHVDLGGGVGISYDGGRALTPAEYAAAVLPPLSGLGLRLLLEPGRVLVGAAGVLLTRVVDIKQFDGGRPFVVADAGMTELLRPALYGAFHRIEPLAPRDGPATRVDIVGPLCETSDTLGADRPTPPLEVGDLLAVRDAGAYGFVMASSYNRRPLPPEVLVEQGQWTVIRRRQTIEDLVALED